MRNCSVFSSPGVRPHNEDTIFAEGDVLIIADGLGGHADGKVASELAVETLSQLLCHEDPAVFVIGGQRMLEGELMEAFLMDAVRQAGAVVLQEARMRGSNMATTVTAVILKGEQAYCAHVGDCALLVSENGDLPPVRRTVEHRRGASLNRTLGSNEQATPDVISFSAGTQGLFLLGCDGFWEHVGETEISQIIEETPDYLLAERLGQAAIANGSPDNVSVIAVVGQEFSASRAERQVELERSRLDRSAVSAEKTNQVDNLRNFAIRNGIPFANPLEEENQVLRSDNQMLENENQNLQEEISRLHNLVTGLQQKVEQQEVDYQLLVDRTKNSSSNYLKLHKLTVEVLGHIHHLVRQYPKEMILALTRPELERLEKIYRALLAYKPPEK